ncbi:MAG: hypothetical protein JWO30_3373 [Fibrobacteres bacterium]|nr:hypothetical protein [Fibrobacterota bacterium]
MREKKEVGNLNIGANSGSAGIDNLKIEFSRLTAKTKYEEVFVIQSDNLAFANHAGMFYLTTKSKDSYDILMLDEGIGFMKIRRGKIDIDVAEKYLEVAVVFAYYLMRKINPGSFD